MGRFLGTWGKQRGASTETWNHKGWWSLSCICIYIYVTQKRGICHDPCHHYIYSITVQCTRSDYGDMKIEWCFHVCIYIYMYIRISIHTLEWINKTRWKATKNVDGWLGALVIAVMDCLCRKKIQGWIHTCSMWYIYTHTGSMVGIIWYLWVILKNYK